MDPQRVDLFTGAMNFLKTMGEPPDEQVTTEIGNITVDTSLPKDTNFWETGIERLGIEGKWVIVEQYPDKNAAEAGHKKWVELMTEYPDYPLKDIDLWSLESYKEE